MNIVLTGLRGSGKTQLGKNLAKKLKWKFVDSDNKIEKEEKKKIAKIVDLKGWEYFRAKESEVIAKIATLDNTVIATGGGAIIDKDNEIELKKNGKIIYLYRQPKDFIKYIKDDPNRAPLTNQETLEEEIAQLYKERNDRYIKSSNLIFHRTDDFDKDADELIQKLGLEV
ncbi:MAG: shikimate kinase [Nitrospirae bacterium]|nr:shikimate kinase [Nitrospirota bacterium]